MKMNIHQSLANVTRPVWKKAVLATLSIASLAAFSGCSTLADWRDENKGIQMEALKTAPGLKVSLFALT